MPNLSPGVGLEARVEGEFEAGHQLLVINYCVEAAKISFKVNYLIVVRLKNSHQCSARKCSGQKKNVLPIANKY